MVEYSELLEHPSTYSMLNVEIQSVTFSLAARQINGLLASFLHIQFNNLIMHKMTINSQKFWYITLGAVNVKDPFTSC
jgi:hypothetical protein